MSVFLSLCCSAYHLSFYLFVYLSVSLFLSIYLYIICYQSSMNFIYFICTSYMYNYMYVYHFIYHLIQLQRYIYLKSNTCNKVTSRSPDILGECQFSDLFSGSCVWSNSRTKNCTLMLCFFLLESSFLYLQVLCLWKKTLFASFLSCI